MLQKSITDLQRIIIEFQTIRRAPGIFQRVRPSLLRRATSCIEDQHGHHFLYNQGSRKSENMLQKAYDHK